MTLPTLLAEIREAKRLKDAAGPYAMLMNRSTRVEAIAEAALGALVMIQAVVDHHVQARDEGEEPEHSFEEAVEVALEYFNRSLADEGKK